MLQSQGTKDAYEVLQVNPRAESVVIHAAYRALARKFHPDGEDPDVDRMAEINRAYAVLRDPQQRRRLDLQRATGWSQPNPMSTAARKDGWMPRRPGDDAVVLDFGRYAGWSISELARHDPDYLRWLCRHSSGIRFRDAIARVLPREPDLQRRGSFVA